MRYSAHTSYTIEQHNILHENDDWGRVRLGTIYACTYLCAYRFINFQHTNIVQPDFVKAKGVYHIKCEAISTH